MATKVVKIDYAIKKINQLKKEFGPDSAVVKFAEDTLTRSTGKISSDYYHRTGKNEGELNVNKLISAYDMAGKRVKDLENKLATETNQQERALIKKDLKDAQKEERELKSQVYIKKTNEVERAFRTPNQILKAEMEHIRDKAQQGEQLSDIEQKIANAKTQKEVRENEDMNRLLTQRANYIAQIANEYNELENKLYDMTSDESIPKDERDQIRELWESRTMTNDWLLRANEVVAKYYGSVIDRDISKLI